MKKKKKLVYVFTFLNCFYSMIHSKDIAPTQYYYIWMLLIRKKKKLYMDLNPWRFFFFFFLMGKKKELADAVIVPVHLNLNLTWHETYLGNNKTYHYSNSQLPDPQV